MISTVQQKSIRKAEYLFIYYHKVLNVLKLEIVLGF
jgi:hypothetical protein